MTDSDQRPSPGGDREGPAPWGTGPGFSWTNLCLAVAGLGLILLMGVSITRGLTTWVQRRAAVLRDRDGQGDAYTYFFDDHELERRLYSALYFPAHHGEEPDAETLERRITMLGHEVVPVILSVLCGDVQLLPGHPPPGLDLGPLSEERRLPNLDVLLVGALWRFEPGRLFVELDSWVGKDALIGQRLIAARVLGGLRDPRAPSMLLRLLTETEPLQFRRPHVRAHFESAIAGSLKLHPDGILEISRELQNIAPAALPVIVTAMPVGTSGEGLDLILDLLERDPDLAPDVLRRISSLASSLHGSALDDTLWQLQWLVENPDWELRRGTAVALGKLQDPNSCPQLIRMLADGDRRVARAALRALRGMSERTFAADQALWQGWYEDERAWFEGPCLELEESLKAEDSAEVIRAVGLLCHRPLFKNHMAVTLGPLLWHADPALVQVVCAALLQLGSQRAVPFLVERLAQREDEATAAVRDTLADLTGLDLPPDQEAWFAALGL